MEDLSHSCERFSPGSCTWRLLPAFLAILLSATLCPLSGQAQEEAQKKVLVFHLMRRDDAAVIASERVYQKTLTDGLPGRLDYYTEHVDLARFGATDYQSALRVFLKQKYKGTDFDLIITTGDLRNFLAQYGAEVFPNTPVVFAMGSDSFDNNATPPNFTGITYDTNRQETLDIIRRLHPNAKRVFVVTGASQAVDKWHEARARKQFEAYTDRFDFTYLSGLPMDDLKRRVATLTPDSVVYFVMMTEDGAGKRYAITEALDQIARVSSVPIYTWHDTFLGHGVVGGRLASSEKVAEKTAELALRILRGERADTIPVTRTDTSRLAFDWHQLQQWKLSESQLPPGSEVLFREATMWERYRNRIIGVIALLALQSALIVALLVERRRRRKAVVDLSESEKRYRNVVETQTEMICRFLPDTTVTFVNEAYCKYFGKAAQVLIGKKFVDFLPESERDSTLRYFASFGKKTSGETREHPVIRPDGTPGWQQWTNTVISFDDGVPVELQGVGRDISERRHLEQQLLSSEQQFSTLVENSPDVICRLDLNLRYIYISPNPDGIFDSATEEFSGKTPREVAVPDYDWNEFESRCRTAIDTRKASVHEFQYRRRHYRTRIIPEYGSDGVVESLMTITEDFTERRLAELELAKLTTRLFTLQDEERRRIARELHDGAAQTIFAVTLNLGRLENVLVDRSPTVTGVINDSQQLAEQSLSELRTLSYLLHPPVLDQAGLADALHWFARGFSQRSAIKVETAAIQEIGRLAPEVETALFRIVQESLSNVRRHSGSDTASILLELRHGEVRLEIRDRGHGMPGDAGNGPPDDKPELGVGIPGMRQRLLQLGGRLDHSSSNGTTILAVIPNARKVRATSTKRSAS